MGRPFRDALEECLVAAAGCLCWIPCGRQDDSREAQAPRAFTRQPPVETRDDEPRNSDAGHAGVARLVSSPLSISGRNSTSEETRQGIHGVRKDSVPTCNRAAHELQKHYFT
jgi:hypothetical protein